MRLLLLGGRQWSRVACLTSRCLWSSHRRRQMKWRGGATYRSIDLWWLSAASGRATRENLHQVELMRRPCPMLLFGRWRGIRSRKRLVVLWLQFLLMLQLSSVSFIIMIGSAGGGGSLGRSLDFKFRYLGWDNHHLLLLLQHFLFFCHWYYFLFFRLLGWGGLLLQQQLLLLFLLLIMLLPRFTILLLLPLLLLAVKKGDHERVVRVIYCYLCLLAGFFLFLHFFTFRCLY